MCIAIPGKVLEIYKYEALVDFGKIQKRVNTSLIEDIQINDYILVHAGYGVEKMNEQEALDTLSVFKMLCDDF
ncbi:MAG: hypC [Clostridia bacterium]|jgi:hydrogenase expression/formation protein HypC|nr:hypC [Clostridia bacterium]